MRALLLLAKAQLAGGKRRKGRATLERVLQLEPANAEAQTLRDLMEARRGVRKLLFVLGWTAFAVGGSLSWLSARFADVLQIEHVARPVGSGFSTSSP